MVNLRNWLGQQFAQATVQSVITTVVTSVAVTVFVATRDSAPAMTSLGWLIVGFCVAFGMVLLAGAVGWARRSWGLFGGGLTATETMLRIQLFADARLPTRRQHGNIWRWYTLKNLIRGRDAEGREADIAFQFILFLVFEAPIAVGQIVVSSPDFRLPDHEVK